MCILLEEEVGINLSSIRLRPVGLQSDTMNVGFNSIFAYSYHEESIDNSNGEMLTNIAAFELGATCTSSSSFNKYECDKGINRELQTEWAAICQSVCIDQFIDITFPYPAQPRKYCYMNSDVVYQLYDSFQYIKFKVKGQAFGIPNECSSLVISFKSKFKKEFSLKFDSVVTGEERSSIEIYHNGTQTVEELSETNSLISCEVWNDYWLRIKGDEIKFGSGSFYNKNLLAKLKLPKSLEIEQILFRNNLGSDIVNMIQITEKSMCNSNFKLFLQLLLLLCRLYIMWIPLQGRYE
ncbi:DgyrCDS14878 [Dimorphilus gyrociliatus]|uniref:DgyrCDS14878 n=1 Tax=Dimorphilus gyrociliatus TaxID=2664684 RepID=A0A7I8WF70_9ANNE|nr:DgyrCDS14878 [Dimorphilus gyrociliatus]